MGNFIVLHFNVIVGFATLTVLGTIVGLIFYIIYSVFFGAH